MNRDNSDNDSYLGSVYVWLFFSFVPSLTFATLFLETIIGATLLFLQRRFICAAFSHLGVVVF